MRWAETIHRPDDQVLRQFAVLLLLVGVALSTWLAWSRPGGMPIVFITAAAVLVGGLGLVRPRWLAPLFIGWMVAAWPVAWIVSMTVLAAVFYIVLTPIALVLRARGRDPLARRLDPHRESYWTPRPTAAEPARYLRQF